MFFKKDVPDGLADVPRGTSSVSSVTTKACSKVRVTKC